MQKYTGGVTQQMIERDIAALTAAASAGRARDARRRGRLSAGWPWPWWWWRRCRSARSTTVGPGSPGDRARNLAETIACPQCDGQSVADSDSEASKAIRLRIDEQIADGASDAQIRDELAAAYGERVLLTPGRSGVSSLVWALPVVAGRRRLRRAGVRVPPVAGRRGRPGLRRRPGARRPGPHARRRGDAVVTTTGDHPAPATPPTATASGRPATAPGRLDPDALAALVEERDFLLRSLDDLEREHDAGDVDDHDYETLKDDYTARAARAIRAIESHRARTRAARRPRSWRRLVADPGRRRWSSRCWPACSWRRRRAAADRATR